MKKALKIVIIPALVLVLLVVSVIFMLCNGIILLNNPSRSSYPVRGVDVSHYQNEIDWKLLASQDIDFAFIKATEGSGTVDECFAYNWSQAAESGLYTGAYHFFSYDSSGVTQAENYINTVPVTENMLPPVIDVEFYGDKFSNPPSREEVDSILSDMIEKLEEHYGMTPIIYATEKSYKMFISGDYEDNPIWIRNVIQPPSFPENDDREWTFWQYSDKGRLKGCSGDEKFIDMNVFNGSMENFRIFFNLV